MIKKNILVNGGICRSFVTGAILITAMMVFPPQASTAASAETVKQEKHIHKLLIAAASRKNKNVTYIITGDSTRQNSFNYMISYYKTQFAKINVSVVNNASSGLDAKDWNADKRSKACLKNAIKKTRGKGKNTIMEYSLGINDQGRKASRDEQKKRYKKGINAYLKAKPKATVILVVPVAHGGPASNNELKEIYTEIAQEMNLILIDALAATKDVHRNKKYYHDGTHPGQWGSRRIVNYIMDQILPSKLYNKVTLEEASKKRASNDKELSRGAEKGYYSDSTGHLGKPIKNSKCWRLKEIHVEPNFILKIKTGAKRNQAFFMNDKGKCVNKIYLGELGNRKYIKVVVPPEGVVFRLTLSLNDNKYNPKKDDISVKYDVDNVNYMSVDDINKGLNIKLKKTK